MSGFVLADHTGKAFHTREAYEAGNPAYNVGFGGFVPLAHEIFGELDDESGQILLAIAGLRHLATAQSLHHPDKTQSMNTLIHA